MKNKKRFLQKVRRILVVELLLLAMGTGAFFGREAFMGQASAKQAMAADEETMAETVVKNEEEKTVNAVQFKTLDAKRIFTESSFGSLWKVAAYKLSPDYAEEEVAEETFKEISTHVLAKEALDVFEEETLQIMALPAGAFWGDKIKVYAGDTPLLITPEDKEVLLRIVEAEATGEDVKGRMLVANVILNRVVSEEFPNSIPEVVFSHRGDTYQFAPVKDGRYWTVRITDKTKEAVERVLAGEDYSQGALYFAARRMANQKAMRWFDTALTYLFTYGVHEFFTEE